MGVSLQYLSFLHPLEHIKTKSKPFFILIKSTLGSTIYSTKIRPLTLFLVNSSNYFFILLNLQMQNIFSCVNQASSVLLLHFPEWRNNICKCVDVICSSALHQLY